MTLDAACELAQKILDMLRDQNKTWDANLFRGAECFVSYAERDGVVYRPVSYTHLTLPTID